MRFSALIPFLTLALAGCASTSVTPVSKNQIIISTSAAPACGTSGAAKVASQMAAVETIRRGYQRFVILGAQRQNNVQAVAAPPMYSTTTGTFTGYGNTVYGNTRTNYYGGGVYYVGSNDADLAVLLLNPGDASYSQGIDAKRELGPEWQEMVENGINTCR